MTTIVLGYVTGAAVHVIGKWAGWKSAQKGRPWMGYWREYSALVVKGATFDFVLFALWMLGLVPWLLSFTPLDMSAFPELPKNVDFLLGSAAGYAADSVGKTFVGGLERLFGAAFRRNGNGR